MVVGRFLAGNNRSKFSQGERGISAHISFFKPLITESLILAQGERWRRASYMQVERESVLRDASTVAHG